MQGETNLNTAPKDTRLNCDDIEYGFACSPKPISMEESIVGLFEEKEGITVIGTLDKLSQLNLVATEGSYARITIEVHTSLELIGLTAILSNKLKEKGIPANVVAGFYHDHIFVPYAQKDLAIESLMELTHG